jgi:hypothetical protein
MIPDAFRDVVTNYFQELAKNANEDENRPEAFDPSLPNSKTDDANGVDSKRELQ